MTRKQFTQDEIIALLVGTGAVLGTFAGLMMLQEILKDDGKRGERLKFIVDKMYPYVAKANLPWMPPIGMLESTPSWVGYLPWMPPPEAFEGVQ